MGTELPPQFTLEERRNFDEIHRQSKINMDDFGNKLEIFLFSALLLTVTALTVFYMVLLQEEQIAGNQMWMWQC